MTRREAIIRKTLLFGSGRLALRKNWRVYLEISDLPHKTILVYDQPEGRLPRNLLYTFGPEKREMAKEHLLLIKEKN